MKMRIRSLLIAVALLPLAPAVAHAGFCFSVTGLPVPAAFNLVPMTAAPDGQVPIVGDAHGVCGPDTPAAAIRGTVVGDAAGVGHVALRFFPNGPGCSGGEADIVIAPPYESGTGQVRLPEGSVADVALTLDPTGTSCAADADPIQLRPNLPNIPNPRTNFSSNQGSKPGVNTNPGSQVASCVPGPTTLCLQGNRFKVMAYKLAPGQFGPGQVASFTSESGLFFFSPSNVEVLVKVLNACTVNDRYWVFASASTDVEYTITVTDTQSAQVKTYFNPLGKPSPAIEDTSAFATCP